MYTEEPKKSINFSGMIKKSLIFVGIIIAILLIIWLFSKISNAIKNNPSGNNNNNVDINYTEDNQNNNTLTNPELYSNEFITGYTYFHDTAKDYFLVHELPKNGETLKYTLQQLINKGLILPFTYKDKETCDLEASYVTVVNQNGKYTFTTTLVCGREVAKTTEELGCNQLCESGNCSVVIPDGKGEIDIEMEYQFKQAYKENVTTYSCPSGYTKDGNYCVKSDVVTTTPYKKTTYSCPEGYDKSGFGSLTICSKDENKVIDPIKETKTTYECESGFTKSGEGEKTICTKTVNATKKETTECPSGYKLNGNKCEKTTTKETEPNYTCQDSSWTKSKSGSTYVCTKTETTTTPKVVVSYNYSCPNGGELSGTTCHKSTPAHYEHYSELKGKTYNGCNYVGSYPSGECEDFYCSGVIYEYYCPAKNENYEATKTPVYGCKNGEPSGNSCIQKTTITEKAKPSCSSGKLNASQTKCVIETKESINPTIKTTYSCTDKNAKLNGTKCTITGNVKVINETNYYCPSGYNKNGQKCTSTGKSIVDYIKKTEYICKDGYTLKNNACTKGSTSRIEATKKTSSVTKYRYKWSTETTLDGWERTGLTRQKTISAK